MPSSSYTISGICDQRQFCKNWFEADNIAERALEANPEVTAPPPPPPPASDSDNCHICTEGTSAMEKTYKYIETERQI